MSSSLPTLRGAAFAAVAVPVGLAGHVLGGGTDALAHPDAGALALAPVVALAIHRALLAVRPRGVLAQWAGLAAVQVALHLLLSGSGHQHGTAHAAGPALAPVLAGHALAVLVLGSLLHRVERATWAATGSRFGERTVRVLVAALCRLARRLVRADAAPRSGPAVTAAALRRLGTAPPHRRRIAWSPSGHAFWRGPPLLLPV